MTSSNPLDYGWWLASRSAGVVSLVAVSVSVIVGLLMANGLPRRAGAKKALLPLHEATALVGLGAIAVHGLTLLGDTWLNASVTDVLVPFTSAYRPFYTGLGILAGWLAAILGLSFYVRRTIGAKLWRTLHRATVVVWALGLVHVLGAGTDAGQPWLQVAMAAGAFPIAFLFILRLMPREEGREVAATASRPLQEQAS